MKPDYHQSERLFVAVLFLIIGGWFLVELGFGPWLVAAGVLIYALIAVMTVVSARRTLAVFAAPSAAGLESDPQDVPDEIRRRLEEAGQTFGGLGFRPLGLVVRELHQGGPREHSALWMDTTGRILAGVTMYAWKDRMIGEEVRGVVTWFEDGRTLETTDLRDRQPLDPMHDLACLSMVRDLKTLVEVHRRRLTMWRASVADAETFDQDELAESVTDRAYRKVRTAALANGYLRAEDAESGAVPTVRGVVVMAGCTLPPCREILRLIERRRGEALLRRVGLAGPAPPRVWVRWLAAGAGLVGVVAGAGALPGIASWMTLGIAGVDYWRRRSGRGLAPGTVLIGATGGLLAWMITLGVLLQGSLVGIIVGLSNPWPLLLFVGGATTLLWGWSGIGRGILLPLERQTGFEIARNETNLA